MMNKKQAFKWMVTCCLSLMGVFLMAQNEAREVTNTYVIKNAIVIQQPGVELPPSHVVIRNGLIQAVGANITIPFDAQVIDADSMYVYAGFIDAASHTGIPKEDPPKRPDNLIPGNPPNDLAGITPERKASDIISGTEKSVQEMRDNGFTMSHVVPSGRMLPGKGAIIVNSSGANKEIVIKDETSMFAQLRSASRMYPATVIAIMAKWRDLYSNAKTQADHAKKFEMNPSGMNRPTMDAATTAMVDVVDGSLPIFFKADKAQDIYRVLRLKNELGLNVIFTDVEQSAPVKQMLKEMNTVVIITSDLPKEEKKKEKKEGEEVDKEVEALEKRKADAQAEYVGQAAMLESEGIPFAFSFLDGKAKDFKKNLLRMMEAGLTPDAALSALTTTPAKLIGVDNLAGTVEVGKMANLIVTDKPYFDEKANIRYVFVDGQMNKYEIKEKKKSSSGEEGAPVALDGEWSYEIEIPGQVQTGKLVVAKSGDDYEVKFASADEPDTFVDGNNISVDGSNLTFDATVENGGFSMNVAFDLEVQSDSFEGTVTAGNFGSFPISGNKLSTPE